MLLSRVADGNENIMKLLMQDPNVKVYHDRSSSPPIIIVIQCYWWPSHNLLSCVTHAYSCNRRCRFAVLSVILA